MDGFIFLLGLWTRQVSSITFAFILSIMEVFVSSDELIAFPSFLCCTIRACFFFWRILCKFADERLRMRASNVIPLAWRAPVAEVDFSTVFTLSPVVRFSSVPALKCYLFLISDTSEGALVISCVVNSNPCPNEIKYLNDVAKGFCFCFVLFCFCHPFH